METDFDDVLLHAAPLLSWALWRRLRPSLPSQGPSPAQV
jgi:hypothetical protein